MPASHTRAEILHELARRVRQVERRLRGQSLLSGDQPEVCDRPAASPEATTLQEGCSLSGGTTAKHSGACSTGIEPLDRLLPWGGVFPGMLMEWLAEGTGGGAGWLALKVAAAVCREEPGPAGRCAGAVVIVDTAGEFYPPAAASLGIDLRDLLVIRPRAGAQGLWAFEQALRCPGVAATFGFLAQVNDRSFRRLQLAAETGGELGLLLRPARAAREPTWADVRLLVRPLPGEGKSSRAFAGKSMAQQQETRRVQIEILHVRGGIGGGMVQLEIDDETGDVRLVPPLAAAEAVPREARA